MFFLLLLSCVLSVVALPSVSAALPQLQRNVR
jgi:hypothetical protein